MKTSSIFNPISLRAAFGRTAFATAALAVLSLSNLRAQDSDNPVRFGVKGGLNYSNLYIDQVNDEKGKLGFHAGVFVKAPLSELFAIQPELLYTSAGTRIARYSNIPFVPDGQINFNLNYIQLPVLAVVTLGRVNIQAGPYVSYLIGANVKNVRVDSKGVPTNGGGNDTRELSRSDFNSLDYGLAAGIAFDIKGFQVGARYNFGLREVGTSGVAGGLTKNAKNSVAQLYVGIGF